MTHGFVTSGYLKVKNRAMAVLALEALQKIAKRVFRFESAQNAHAREAVIKKAKDLVRSNARLKLEIGSGFAPRKNGWITLDRSCEADLCWDLMLPLPFPDDSISIIYSSHVLEHFYYSDLMQLLKSCFRCLKSGGEFSACVPNAGLYVKGYLDPTNFDKGFLTYKPAVISELKMDIINYIAYMDGHHKYMFDEENIVEVLKKAGFTSVKLRQFDPNLDLQERDYESIYVSAIKP